MFLVSIVSLTVAHITYGREGVAASDALWHLDAGESTALHAVRPDAEMPQIASNKPRAPLCNIICDDLC